MQNKSVTKILLGIFIMGISFLGLNVFAASSANSPSECSSVTNYSASGYSQNSSNGTVFQNNGTWYINNNSAIELGFSLCTADYCKNATSSAVKNYRDKILGLSSYNSHEEVWNLQKKLKDLGCSVTPDCKLGTKTLGQYFNCDVCSKSGFTSPKSLDGNNIVCETGKSPVLSGVYKDVCCEVLSCTKEPTINQTEFEGDDSFEVTITYEKDKNVEITGDIANYITLEGCIETTPDKSKVKIQDNTVTFEVCPNGVSSIINITVKQGYGKAGESQCPGATFKLTSKGCKNLPSETGACFSGLINVWNCCIECSNPPDENDSCGSGFKQGAGGCCECDTEAKQKLCADGETVNSGSCKCVCDPTKACCGVKLNTVVPFIGDCIEMTTSNDVNSSSRTGTVTVNQLNAFPFLMQGLMKILITVILIFSVIIVIVAGLMMTADPALSTYKKGMDLLKNVIISLILLGCSGLILKLINPSFFGG